MTQELIKKNIEKKQKEIRNVLEEDEVKMLPSLLAIDQEVKDMTLKKKPKVEIIEEDDYEEETKEENPKDDFDLEAGEKAFNEAIGF